MDIDIERLEKTRKGKGCSGKSKTITVNETGVPEALCIWVAQFMEGVAWGSGHRMGWVLPCHALILTPGPILLIVTTSPDSAPAHRTVQEDQTKWEQRL